MIDMIFDACVDLLAWTADKLGTTYKAINVWTFCACHSRYSSGQTAAIIWLLYR